jgi:hypothetical protein
MPGDGLTHGPPATKNAGGSPTGLPATGIPCAMVLTLISRSPRGTGLIAPSPCGSTPQDLIPASEDQDHATSPSAPARFVRAHWRVHRIPASSSVTIAKRPSSGWRDGATSCMISGIRKSRIWAERGGSHDRIEPAHKISFEAQAILAPKQTSHARSRSRKCDVGQISLKGLGAAPA